MAVLFIFMGIANAGDQPTATQYITDDRLVFVDVDYEFPVWADMVIADMINTDEGPGNPEYTIIVTQGRQETITFTGPLQEGDAYYVMVTFMGPDKVQGTIFRNSFESNEGPAILEQETEIFIAIGSVE